MKEIYMDNAATTPVGKEVTEAMEDFFNIDYGNPSSLHSFGQKAKKAIEEARENVASLINADSDEIVFTSGGTESDNLAIKGVAFHAFNCVELKGKKPHIITSRIEHPAVLEVCRYLEGRGFEVTYLKVDSYGLVDPKDVEKAIKKSTILVSIMHANNEIGTIEPIEPIAKICKKHKVLFHTDAVQTFGKVPIDVKKMGIDLLSASGHKIHGPKGVGCLYVRRGVKLSPQIHGGGHEGGMRSGTENVTGIVGFSEACSIAKSDMKEEHERVKKLRDALIEGILEIPNTRLNGHPTKRLPGNANFSFDFIEGESLVLRLDAAGLVASTGSACSTKKLSPSHVLTAIGLKPEESHGSLRLTLGRWNDGGDIFEAKRRVRNEVEALREMSPIKR